MATRYVAPSWLLSPQLVANSRTSQIYSFLQGIESGATVPEISKALELSDRVVRRGIAGLQSGTRACILVFNTISRQNIRFVVARLLHHLRWGESEQARLTFDWYWSQDPDLEAAVLDYFRDVLTAQGLYVYAPSISDVEAHRIGSAAALFISGLYSARGMRVSTRVHNRSVTVFDGAEIIDLNRYRIEKTQSFVAGHTNVDRVRALLMVLSGLRRRGPV